MRLKFQEKPWDLYASLGYTLVMTGVILGFGVGNLAAILLVCFVPGYVLAAALFPGDNQIDWIERSALSFGLSIAIVVLLSLVLNFTPFGVRFAPVVLEIALFTILVGATAWWRRIRLAPLDRLSATISVSATPWKEYSPLDKSLAIALGATLVFAATAFAYIVVTPRPSERFTEFYFLGLGGNASGYPTRLNRSQPSSVLLGIVNHEAASVNYTVRVDLVGVEITYNATVGANETTEVNRTTWSFLNVTLANGQNWTRPYSFRINDTGFWKVQILLFKDGVFSPPYRELHWYVRVS